LFTMRERGANSAGINQKKDKVRDLLDPIHEKSTRNPSLPISWWS
jgi:hypothetical protein